MTGDDAAKRAMVEALRAVLADELRVLRSAADDAREASTHEEAKPENDKDTRAIEAGYLAGAQAERVRDVAHTHAALGTLPLPAFGPGATVSAGALVTLEDADGHAKRYLMAPAGGGLAGTIDGVTVHVITPVSPIGRALLGRAVGDEIDVEAQRTKRTYTVIAIE